MDNIKAKKLIYNPGKLMTIVAIVVLLASMGNPHSVEQNGPFISKNTGGLATPDSGKNVSQQNEERITVNKVNSIFIDKDNVKWFSTDVEIVRFDGITWKRYGEHTNLPVKDFKSVACVVDTGGSELWIASLQGATVIKLPMGDTIDAITHDPDNSGVLSQEVLGIAVGENSIQWVGSRFGVSAFSNNKWLTLDYQMHYTKNMFRDFPITSMATNDDGDSLYVGTAGAGVARLYHDELDAISGASVYAEWGPIILPSDYILSVFIAPDGVKWFGTDKGIAKHTGNDTLDNWTVYTEDDGLIDNYIQAISGDKEGNIWFGTREGLSVFNGSSWLSYTTDDGLASNNIFSLAIDNEGIVWIGSDVGITSCQNGEFINH
jgi:ligand-binding sensor domain-containing protein